MTDLNTTISVDASLAAESAIQGHADNLVHREVMACMSVMVSTLAGSYGERCGGELDGLVEQAFDLASPISDYEEAAIQAGWNRADGEWQRPATSDEIQQWKDDGAEGTIQSADSAEDACSLDEIEPYDREVYQHWAVSTWLAEKLAEAGERVDTDFAGLNVWARTTTEQAISMDGVIRDITRALHA